MKEISQYITEALKKLGQGEEGKIYDMGDGKVKKVFHNGRVPLSYQLLLAATKTNDIEVLPKVYEVGDDYIVRENCTPGTELVKKYWKTMTWKPFTNDSRMIWQMVRDGEWWMDYETGKGGTHLRMALKGITKDVIDWLLRLQYELSQICGDKAGLGDLDEKNLGETEDGRIVMYDF